MAILSSIILAIGIALLVFRSSYRGELAISFLPYWAVLFLIGLIIALWRLFVRLYTKDRKVWFFTAYAHFFVLGFWTIFLLLSQDFWSFYRGYQLEDQLSHPITILYSNIYKDNHNYEDIISHIEQEKADILLFVEFETHHRQQLTPLLRTHYPYILKGGNSSLVASKYPLEQLETWLEEERWNYQYFRMQTDQDSYLFYLIHTSSPTKPSYFLNRNAQLMRIANDFQQQHWYLNQTSAPKQEKIIMLGDFNVSPWSKFYKAFEQKLDGKLINSTRAFPMFMSWDLAKLLDIADIATLPSLLKSHIDHSFVSPWLKVSQLRPVQFSGSDHTGLVFLIE